MWTFVVTNFKRRYLCNGCELEAYTLDIKWGDPKLSIDGWGDCVRPRAGTVPANGASPPGPTIHLPLLLTIHVQTYTLPMTLHNRLYYILVLCIIIGCATHTIQISKTPSKQRATQLATRAPASLPMEHAHAMHASPLHFAAVCQGAIEPH